MDADRRCGNCRFWEYVAERFPKDMQPCSKMPCDTDKMMIHLGPPRVGGAYVHDGCCGPGSFVTHADFYCALFEPKP